MDTCRSHTAKQALYDGHCKREGREESIVMLIRFSSSHQPKVQFSIQFDYRHSYTIKNECILRIVVVAFTFYCTINVIRKRYFVRKCP